MSDSDTRDTVALVPAAGRGERLGPGAPKSLRHLGGEPLVVHAVRRLAAARSVAAVVVAAPPGAVQTVRELLLPVVADAELIVVEGGDTRQSSVAAALAAAPTHCDVVLVHDAARALAPPGLADEVAAAVRAGHPAVVPVLPVVDTVRQVGADGLGSSTVDRELLRLVQTPQGFARAVLAEAHAAVTDAHDEPFSTSGPGEGRATAAEVGRKEFTDDAGLVERLGLPVHTVAGHPSALKVTRPFDLVVAHAVLAAEAVPDDMAGSPA